MLDSYKTMKTTLNGISLTVLGLVIAAIGVVSPIAWDWWNKRSQISIETKSTFAFVASSQPIKNLEFTYNGRKVSELQKIVLLLKNSGRTPITKDDIVSPLTIAFSADEILEATLVRQTPPNLNTAISSQKNAITFAFALLNPGDEAEIEVLTAGKYSGYSAEARIKNIDAISISNPTRTINIRSDFGFGVYIAGAFGLILFAVGVTLLSEIPRKKRATAGLLDGTHRILHAQSIEEAIRYFHSDMQFLSGLNKTTVRRKISDETWPLDNKGRAELREISLGCIEAEDSFGPSIIGFVSAGISFWYVLSNVLG